MNQTNCTAQALVRLSGLTLIAVAGADRVHFLQGQLTNDVTKLTDGMLMPAGYCSPKGRLLATPRLFMQGETIYMIVPTDQAEMLLKRLKMFVMRSKVTLTRVEDLALYASFGSAASSLGLQFALTNGTPEILKALGLPAARTLIIDKAGLEACDDDALFAATEIAAGQTWVHAATMDQFVPQGVNLECFGGVSFNKGCYTGQEIVSRVEHIGKTNRRAALALIDTDQAPALLTDVLDPEGNPCGLVVDAAVVNGKTVCLVQLSVADIEKPDLKATVNGAALTIYNLPYTYTRAQ